MLGLGLRSSTASLANVLRVGLALTLPPVANWRLPITGAVTDSAGDATTQTAIQNSSANRRDAVFSLAANQARTFVIPVAAINAAASPGGLLNLSSFIQDSYLEDPTTATESNVQQSFDNGSTWTDLTLAQGSKLDRGRAWHIPVGAARLIRFTVTAGSSACSGTVGVRQRPANGIADIWLIEGASFEDRAYKPYQFLAIHNAMFPSFDPMVFNEGRAGSNSAQIRARIQTEMSSTFPLATIVIANQAGNTVTATRPYSAGNATALALDGEVSAMIQAVLDAGRIPLVEGISYRDYPSPNPVNAGANPENGSLPYNINEVYPVFATKTPDQFDSALGVARCDVYAFLRANPSYLSGDGVHLFTKTGWNALISFQLAVWGAKIYGTALPASLYEQYVAAAESAKTQASVNAAQVLLDILQSSSAKTGLQNRLGAVVVPSTAPVNTAAPTISGTPQVGQTLTASQGSWNNSPQSYAYQWSAGGTAISGATSSTYIPASADVGKTITVTVMATNGSGSASATSAATSAVQAAAAAAPVNTAAPTISGTPQVGQTLTASQGTWSNSPQSYAYQWAAGGTAISGATSSTYVPVTADVGKTLTVTVTATNGGGSASATSAATSAVVAAAATVRRVQVSPYTTANTAKNIAGWNDAKANDAGTPATAVPLKDSNGNATGLSVYFTVTGGASVLDNSQSAPTSTTYPQAISNKFLYLSQGTLTANIIGFQPNADVFAPDLLSSRDTTNDRTGAFTSGGVTKSINAKGNTALLVFDNTKADANGLWTLTMALGSPQQGGPFAYLNGFTFGMAA